jgi:hypothetical protein
MFFITRLKEWQVLTLSGDLCCVGFINAIGDLSNDERTAQGYNWATLFLGDINTGIWPSRLGESQMRQ